MLQIFSVLVLFEAFFLANRPLKIRKSATFWIEFIKLCSCQNQVALTVERDDLLPSFSHEEMLAENDVIKNTADAENITDRMGLCRHIFNVNNLWSNISRSSTSHKQVIWIIGYCR